ncbi:DUF3422 family protein [Sphingopyxis panaciterrae]
MRHTDFGLDDHPLRTALASEMHVRKLPAMTAPTRMMQVVLLCDKGDVALERRKLADLFVFDEGEASDGASFLIGERGGLRIVWERHTEFSSYMFIRPGAFDDPFDPATFAAIPDRWFAGLPGKVVRATQFAFCDGTIAERAAGFFSAEDLVVCDVADGAGRIWSDFRIHDDGFGRLLLADKGLTGAEASLVVQRVQELGNYRNMALLGLPMAQRLTPQVSGFEARLAALSSAIAAGESSDENLLRDLSVLSAELAGVVAETRYRMSASRAYSQISHDRLAGLRVGRVQGYQTLADFTDRRLLPAVRTCISFSARLEDLSQRLAWTSSLMRTRVDTALSRQNRDLLASMDRRTDLQLRLQQTVEGLSVVAISYYLVGLVGYASKGWALGEAGHDALMAAAVPLALALTWLGMKRIRRKFAHA